MKSKVFPKIGDYVTVTTEHDNIERGWLFRCVGAVNGQSGRFQGELVYAPEDAPYQMGQLLNFRKSMVEPTTRERRAELCEMKATALIKKAEESTAEAINLRAEAKRLRQFASDAEAMADALAHIWRQEVPNAKKLRLIADVVGDL